MIAPICNTTPKRRRASLATRLKLMLRSLGENRRTPRIYTEMEIDRLDGNRDFFALDVPTSFAGANNTALLAEFKAPGGYGSVPQHVPNLSQRPPGS